MNLLGVDIGTTHCKAGLFDANGTPLKLARHSTPTRFAPEGYAYYDPEELWDAVAGAIREAAGDDASDIGAVGIASMAETGLLIDRKTGEPRSVAIPWFDSSATPQANLMNTQADPLERFSKTGTRITAKCSLAKLLWLRQRGDTDFDGALWLSAADYVLYRLTGETATDYSLAGRTCAFDIQKQIWDEVWLEQLGLVSELFPNAKPSGWIAGTVHAEGAAQSGLSKGTPVTITGHDHVCAALAGGVVKPGLVFDSIGTAESLVGSLEARALGEREFASGLYFGCYMVAGLLYWMGGMAASGGSLEWFRSQLAIAYDDLETLVSSASPEPTGILFYPYLSRNRVQRSDAKAAFIGLDAWHSRADLLKAVLEGTAFEIETVRRSAEETTGIPIERIVAGGGGVREQTWMQVRADVSGCQIDVCPLPEMTLLGAAILAATGVGLYTGVEDAVAGMGQRNLKTTLPDAERHRTYQRLYEEGYLTLQGPLRRYYQNIDTD